MEQNEIPKESTSEDKSNIKDLSSRNNTIENKKREEAKLEISVFTYSSR